MKTITILFKLIFLISMFISNHAFSDTLNKIEIVGNDADFCIVDLFKPWIVKKENMISKSKNTCIEDKKLQGKVLNTYIKGVELYKC